MPINPECKVTLLKNGVPYSLLLKKVDNEHVELKIGEDTFKILIDDFKRLYNFFDENP